MASGSPPGSGRLPANASTNAGLAASAGSRSIRAAASGLKATRYGAGTGVGSTRWRNASGKRA